MFTRVIKGLAKSLVQVNTCVTDFVYTGRTKNIRVRLYPSFYKRFQR